MDNTIRYLSTHDNQFLRYFKGHKNTVKTLTMSPVSDAFISGSQESVRVWDLRSSNCQGLMSIQSPSVQIAIDPQGLVFAVGLENKSIRLFDIRNYSQGPFSVFSLQIPSTEGHSKSTDRYYNSSGNSQFSYQMQSAFSSFIEWSSLEFSPDGKDILISTKESSLVLIDSFEGFVKERYEKNTNDECIPLNGCFSPDGKWIMCGSGDGSVNIWRHSTSSTEFNSKYLVFAALSGKKLSFLIPEY